MIFNSPVLTSVSSGNWYTTLIGNGVDTTYTVTHNLSTASVVASIIEISSGAMVYPDINIISNNAIEIIFNIVPTSNAYRVNITGS